MSPEVDDDPEGPWVDEADFEESTDNEVQEVPEEEPIEEVKEEKKEVKKPKNISQDEWEEADITDPKVQARFNRIYGQMKHSKAEAIELAKNARTLADQNKSLQERLKSLEERLSNQEVSTTKSRLDQLIEQRKEAAEVGDVMRAIELTEKIAELKTVKEPTKQEPVEEEATYEEEDDSALDAESQRVLQEYMLETDNFGRLKRPWALPNHKDFTQAAAFATAIAEEAERDGIELDTSDLFKQIDKRMNRYLGVPQRKANPLDNEQAVDTKGTVVLNDAQRSAALKIFNDLPKDEAIALYTKELMDINNGN